MDREAPAGAEVGVLRGHLSACLLGYLPTLRLLMVDNWPLEPGVNYSTPGFNDPTPDDQRRARKQAEQNTEFASERRLIIWQDSVQAASGVVDASLDFVFIDADHSYEGCKADIQAWRPKVRPGGLLCGHDYRHPTLHAGVTQAVDEYIAATGVELELGKNWTWFTIVPGEEK
jgi:hypothetical protein